MTLPGMIREALCKLHGDDNRRLVYPLERYRLELGEPDTAAARHAQAVLIS